MVIHIDNEERILLDLKSKIELMGIPFEPNWGKYTKGFRAANIWIGRQYFEIIRLMKPDGGGWEERWVTKYNEGKRGAFCFFLVVSDIFIVAEQLKKNGVPLDGPKRLSFTRFFGFFKKVLPWQLVYLPSIPGTELEIGFIQYDPDPKDQIKQYLVPNSDVNGILGFNNATVELPMTKPAQEFLAQIFPHGEILADCFFVPLETGVLKFENAKEVRINLKADSNQSNQKGKSFSVENVYLFT